MNVILFFGIFVALGVVMIVYFLAAVYDRYVRNRTDSKKEKETDSNSIDKEGNE